MFDSASMLWYLVVPPFVIVISFGALLWLLSRRAGDEEVSRNLSLAQAESASGAHSRSLSRRAFFLKLIEKTASRFKTMTLRIHNFFQHSLERVRRRRSELDAIRKHMEQEEEKEEKEEDQGGSGQETRHSDATPDKARSRGFRSLFGKRGRRKEENEEGISKDTAKRVPAKSLVSDSDVSGVLSAPPTRPVNTKQDVISKPVLKRETARPDTDMRRPGKDPREVSLLSRIVENPRDISAYEELGDWYFAERSMEDAKECYRQALKLHPTNRAIKIKIRKLEKFFEGKAE